MIKKLDNKKVESLFKKGYDEIILINGEFVGVNKMKDTDRANLIFRLERAMHQLESLQATMDLVYPSVMKLLHEVKDGR